MDDEKAIEEAIQHIDHLSSPEERMRFALLVIMGWASGVKVMSTDPASKAIAGWIIRAATKALGKE